MHVCLGVESDDQFNPLYTGNPKRILLQTVKTQVKCSIINSEDPDEMQQNAAFHQGLHLYGQKYTTIKNILALTPKNVKWTIPYLLNQYIWENPLEHKGLT